VRSFDLRIGDDVYRKVLRDALRTFFYQRAGFEKKAQYAGSGWADGASHVGPGQDRAARLFSAPDDPRTEQDLSGGWYDAGDYNRYTNWAAQNVGVLLKAYRENPAAFSDDIGIPESGNGVPDILDEVKCGMDWLARMQNDDGSVLSVLGVSHASPPSAATGPSFYGAASTSATLSAAAAFALGASVYRDFGSAAYAAALLERGERAYRWAEANPHMVFRNNDAAAGTEGLAAGQQEVDDYGRLTKKFAACVYLLEATGKLDYRNCVDANLGQLHLIAAGYASPYEAEAQQAALRYAQLPGARPLVADRIRSTFATAMRSNFEPISSISPTCQKRARSAASPRSSTTGSPRGALGHGPGHPSMDRRPGF